MENLFGKLNFSVALNPTSAFPLDARIYFTSLADAEAAAQTAEPVGSFDTVYYIGQKLLVNENNTPKWYSITAEKTLIEEGNEGGNSIINIPRNLFQLLIEILEAALYNSDQSDKIMEFKKMVDALATPDQPDIPDEPDPPVVYINTAALGMARLGCMRLTGTKTETPEEPEHSGIGDTTSALGAAKLGCTHLGNKYEIQEDLNYEL